jgi:hypothetical protein
VGSNETGATAADAENRARQFQHLAPVPANVDERDLARTGVNALIRANSEGPIVLRENTRNFQKPPGGAASQSAVYGATGSVTTLALALPCITTTSRFPDFAEGGTRKLI